MNDELISHMRDRIRRARRVVELAGNPEIVTLLEEMIAEAEADLIRLEAEQIPPPTVT